jgi:L-alanine-DL-glutamate epimerase-like enolase superfamily enzyme
MHANVPIHSLTAAAYTIPTDAPESDGTLEWDYITLVLAQATAADHTGIGYSYTHESVASLISRTLAPVVQGRDAMDVPGTWEAMRHAIRNLGRPGLASTAIAAVDTALWDLKAKLLGKSLLSLLGAVHDGIPVYGSGGFTSYSLDRLRSQLAAWVANGIPRVKMKIGREPMVDMERVRAARDAIGPCAQLFVGAAQRRDGSRRAGC